MPPILLALISAGVMTREEAERVHRQLDPNAARDYAERVLTQAMQSGFAGQQDRLLDLLRRTGNQPTDAQWTAFWRREDDILLEQLRPPLLDVAGERAVSYAVNAGMADTWRMVNESVIDWAQTYYANADAGVFGSVPNLNLTSRTRVLQAWTDWQRGELQTAGAADGLPQLIRALEPVFGPERAERIAVTETTRIFSEATVAAEMENEFSETLRILTAADELVCPICGPLHNQVIPKRQDGGFVHPTWGAAGYPPFHVRCRCFVMGDTMAAGAVTLPQDAPRGDVPFTTTARPTPPTPPVVVAPPEPVAPRVPTFKTTKEAEEWARGNLNFSEVDFSKMSAETAQGFVEQWHKLSSERKGDPIILDYVGPLKNQYQKIGKKFKRATNSHVLYLVSSQESYLGSGQFGKPKLMFGYSPELAGSAESLSRTITQLHKSGVIRNIDSAAELLTHEFGHAVDSITSPGGFGQTTGQKIYDAFNAWARGKDSSPSVVTSRVRSITDEVGSYIDTNAAEFFAEVYRLHKHGKMPPELGFIGDMLDELGKN
jgi:hypothetical protein